MSFDDIEERLSAAPELTKPRYWSSSLGFGLVSEFPIVPGKLHRPHSHESSIPRKRLTAILDGLHEKRFALVCAPAGFGKSTLVADWINQSEWDTAWVTFDANDNHPVAFWTYFATALKSILPDTECIGGSLVGPLPMTLPGTNRFAVSLLAAMESLEHHSVIVLDDYHEIEAQEIHESVAYLVDNLPPRMHLVVISRTTPPLPLARWRARQELCEIDGLDLAFTDVEAESFFNEKGDPALPHDDVLWLNLKTEGWPVGLKLAELSLRGREDVAGFVRKLSGSNRYIADYLTLEVVQKLPSDIREFLLKTSVLNRLCSDLCNALIDAPGGSVACQSKLEYLEREGLFLIPLDEERRWYRYHTLFSEMLLRQFEVEHSSGLAQLYRTASLWFEQHGFLADAVSMSLAAKDDAETANLIERSRRQIMASGQMGQMLDWLDTLPAKTVAERPRLQLAKAWALIPAARFDEVEECLARSEELTARDASATSPESPDSLWSGIEAIWGEVESIRALVGLMMYDPCRMLASSQLALQLLPQDQSILRELATLVLGAAYLITGELDSAKRTLTQPSLSASGHLLVTYFSKYYLAETYKVEGKLCLAAETFEQAIEIAEEADDGLPLACHSHVGLADILYRWNRLDDALYHANRGLALSTGWNMQEIIYEAATVLSCVHLSRGEEDEAVRCGARACNLWNGDPWAKPFNPSMPVSYIRFLVNAGLQDQSIMRAVEFLQSYRSENGALGVADLLMAESAAFLLVASRKAEGIGALLDSLKNQFQSQGRVRQLVETLVLETVFLQEAGDDLRALDSLESALRLAEPEGYIRTFVDEGLPMRRLLQRARLLGVTPSYAARLLAAFPQEHCATAETNRHSRSQLSERELEVLTLLSTGLSVGDIAHQLYIQQDTVRQHLKSCYAKLQVHSQAQAVSRAKEIGLA